MANTIIYDFSALQIGDKLAFEISNDVDAQKHRMRSAAQNWRRYHHKNHSFAVYDDGVFVYIERKVDGYKRHNLKK